MKQKLLNYQPFNEQEEKDKELLLKVIEQKDVLTRKNTIGHFTVSCWVLNQSHDKVLMCYHKIYNSWCWLGGHVDGQKDFKKVALKEFQEESGLKHVQFLKDDPFSIEVLTVNGHIKNGVYVSSHLHYNITYLMEADDQETVGYGHGVGMSQSGANAMGKNQSSYQQILQHYYTGVSFGNVKDFL